MSSALAKKTDCLLRRRFTTERLGLVLKGCFALHKHEFPLHGFELLSLLACRWLLSRLILQLFTMSMIGPPSVLDCRLLDLMLLNPFVLRPSRLGSRFT